MKLIYIKPRIFPKWTKFKGDEHRRPYYVCEGGGISFMADHDTLPHYNHIEMSGFETSSIISYKIDTDKSLRLYRFCVFPQVRVIPNETRGSLSYNFDGVRLLFDSPLRMDKVEFNGVLSFYQNAGDVEITHTICPAYDKKALLEKITVKNTSDKQQAFSVENKKSCKKNQ